MRTEGIDKRIPRMSPTRRLGQNCDVCCDLLQYIDLKVGGSARPAALKIPGRDAHAVTCTALLAAQYTAAVMAAYDPLQALVKLRATVWPNVERLASTLTADQRVSDTFVAFDANVRPGINVAIQNYYLDHRATGISREQAVVDVERQRDDLAKQNRVFMIMMHMPNDMILVFLREQGAKDLVALEAWLDIAPPANNVKLLLVAGTKMQLFHVPAVSAAMRN